MTDGPFLDLYRSDLQAFYALWIVPALFLGWLLVTPAARSAARARDPEARFVYRYCVVFAIEAIIDPFATGPLVQALGLQQGLVGTAVVVAFVLMGDFRVLLLLFRLAAPGSTLASSARDAALWTAFVPLVAFGTRSVLEEALGSLPPQTIWLLYEIGFLGLALWLRQRGLPAWIAPEEPRRLSRLQAIASYVALYYGLWALADALLLTLDLDVAWALRIVPNQLYYSLYLPFVYFQLSSRR